MGKLFHCRNVIFLAPALTKGCYFQCWAGAGIREPGRQPQSIFEKKRQPDDFPSDWFGKSKSNMLCGIRKSQERRNALAYGV